MTRPFKDTITSPGDATAPDDGGSSPAASGVYLIERPMDAPLTLADAYDLFMVGHNTADIADILGVDEAQASDAIYWQREKMRCPNLQRRSIGIFRRIVQARNWRGRLDG
jgi:hypothetical protein